VTDDPVRALAKFAAGQWGVVSRAELIALGLSAKQVKVLVRRGHLHLLHRGVYAVGHRNVTTEGRFLAAVKACGPEAVLSHYCAACHRGWVKCNGRPIDVTAPTKRTRPMIRTHRSNLIELVNAPYPGTTYIPDLWWRAQRLIVERDPPRFFARLQAAGAPRRSAS
jgi:hypothetical protein